MTAIGGSIESVTINGRRFPVAADVDSSRILGGFQQTSEPNGDGTSRILKVRLSPAISDIPIVIDDARSDQDFLTDITELNDFVPIAVTYASGITYQGRAQIGGDWSYSSANSTATISLVGTGKFTQQ